MSTSRTYATARRMVDPDADYVVHVRTDTGWKQPGGPEQRQLPGLDVLVAARRVLRAQPAGSVWCTPEVLNVRTGDGRLWLRFTARALAETDRCDTPGCAEFLSNSGHCTRCATEPALNEGCR